MLDHLLQLLLINHDLSIRKSLCSHQFAIGGAFGAMSKFTLQGANLGAELTAAARTGTGSFIDRQGSHRLAAAATSVTVAMRVPA